MYSVFTTHLQQPQKQAFWVKMWKYCHALCVGCRNMESVSFQASLVSLIMCKPKINEPALCVWKKSAVFGYFCTNTSQILTEVRELLYHKLISFCRGCLRKLGDYSLKVPVSLQCEKSLIAAVWTTSSDELPGAGWDESPREGPWGDSEGSGLDAQGGGGSLPSWLWGKLPSVGAPRVFLHFQEGRFCDSKERNLKYFRDSDFALINVVCGVRQVNISLGVFHVYNYCFWSGCGQFPETLEEPL